MHCSNARRHAGALVSFHRTYVAFPCDSQQPTAGFVYGRGIAVHVYVLHSEYFEVLHVVQENKNTIL